MTDALEQLSPIHQVDRIQAPLLIEHGANDPRVPVSEAEHMVSALQKRHIPVSYLRYDGEGHYMQRKETQVSAYGAIFQWFERYMG